MLASGPSMGFTLVRLPVPVKATLASELKLQLPSTTVPEPFTGVLLARSVLAKTQESIVTPPVAAPLIPDEPGLPGEPLPEPQLPPGPPAPATLELNATVQLVIRKLPEVSQMPPEAEPPGPPFPPLPLLNDPK